MGNDSVENIKMLMRHFKVPPRDFFEECMLIAEDNNSFYHKGGIFICSKDCINHYAGLEEFWVRSFFSFLENVWIGDLFHKVIHLIHWKRVSPEDFSQQYFDLLKKYSPEQTFLEGQMHAKSYIDLENRRFSNAISILNNSISSSTAISDGNYISYFIIDDDIGLRNKWPKET